MTASEPDDVDALFVCLLLPLRAVRRRPPLVAVSRGGGPSESSCGLRVNDGAGSKLGVLALHRANHESMLLTEAHLARGPGFAVHHERVGGVGIAERRGRRMRRTRRSRRQSPSMQSLSHKCARLRFHLFLPAMQTKCTSRFRSNSRQCGRMGQHPAPPLQLHAHSACGRHAPTPGADSRVTTRKAAAIGGGAARVHSQDSSRRADSKVIAQARRLRQRLDLGSGPLEAAGAPGGPRREPAVPGRGALEQPTSGRIFNTQADC